MELTIDTEFLGGLSKRQMLELEAKIIGYQRMPPTIREFIEDPYYLGNIYGGGKLYKFWLPILEQIFPDPIHIRYNTVVLTGAIGIGKSTVTRIAAAYTKCRLDHMSNFNYFDLAKGKNLVMSYFHTSGDLVDNTFIDPLKKLGENSPYFKEGLLNKHVIEDKGDTPKMIWAA